MATTLPLSPGVPVEPEHGPRRAPALPARVRRAILALQAESEKLIGWIQLAVVATFATLYMVAPRTAPAEALNPVPWVLAAYGLFTVLRLVLAHRGRLAGWFLCLSVVVDMGLLMGLIWSFHLQYMQPAAFYLKAPTLLYVFIFIALRALRFEPQFIVLSGVTAIVGWSVLVAYAVIVDPGMPVTRDYVAYMTSATILIGAELDKLITIGLVTLILALAVQRARRLLERSVAETQAAADLSRFFDPEIAEAITSAEQPLAPGEGKLRRAAVLYADLRGFTTLAARLPPSEVIGLLTEYQGRLVPLLHRHGGSVDKFLGDGIMATFGALRPREAFAADALRAAADIVGEIEAWNSLRSPELRLRVAVAVAHGDVVVGAVGDEERLEYTVIGSPVNLAAKLEKHCAVEGARALVTEATLDLAREQGFEGAGTRLGPRSVGGVEAPVDLVRLDR
jgi:adenylate cyclase